MKQFHTLGLISFSLLSLSSYAENSFNYKKEFLKCLESANFKTVTHTINNAPASAQRVEKKRSLTMIFLGAKDNPKLLTFIEKVSTTYSLKTPRTVIVKVNTPFGAVALDHLKENRNDTIFIDQDFLLEANDEDLETFIVSELTRLKSIPEEVYLTANN